MEIAANTGAVAIEARRVSTGDAGLDRALDGGLFRGAITILQGTPGAGKTTLANQMAFENARRGGHTVYITLLSESHGRMTAALTPMRFFDETEVGQSIHYVSGYHVLMDAGAPALLRLVAEEARRHQANLVVLDGLFVLGDAGLDESEYRRFVNDLALQAELMGATVLLLTNTRRAADSPEYTMVDGWLELGQYGTAHRASRFIEVHKLRGSGFLPGRHRLRLSTAGLEVFPRLESYLGQTAPEACTDRRLSTGLPAFDALLHGGLPTRTNTLVWGATGVGKTTFGFHFLAASSAESPGLLFTFYESPGECVRNARERGIDLETPLRDGHLHIAWHPPTEHDIDELAHLLLDHVRRHGTQRVVIDAIDAFEKVAIEPGRLNRFLSALCNELRSANCTSMFISEVPELFGQQPSLLTSNRSAIGQNIVLLRYAQRGAELCRTVAMLKVRESSFETCAHAFTVTGEGVRIGGPLDPRALPVVIAAGSERGEG